MPHDQMCSDYKPHRLVAYYYYLMHDVLCWPMSSEVLLMSDDCVRTEG
jgi:hypothetical protein